MKYQFIDWRIAGMIFAAGVTMVAIPGCGEDGPLGNIAKECGLVCPAEGEGIVAGNAAISGNAKIDGFFAAVVNFDAKAKMVAGNIEAELAKIKAKLGLEGDATGAEVKAAMVARFELDADADIRVKFQEPRCDVSASATIEATARCDATVTPGMATVECHGSCEVEASAEASCEGTATAKCVGQADGPMLSCSGECSGSCELTAAATCEGTCKGTCEGTCSAQNTDGSCNGTCEGMCQGTCEMTAKGSCSGQCKGECEYDPPSADVMCEAGATVRCQAMANASVECNGKCEGEVTPPRASAECEASAKAEAEVNVECTPPQLTLEYQFAANASAEAQLEFEAFLTGFVESYGKIVAELKRADVVLTAGANIASSATGAVQGSVEATLEGDVSIKEGFLLKCAVDELPNVATLVTDASGRLEGSISAAAELTGEFSPS